MQPPISTLVLEVRPDLRLIVLDKGDVRINLTFDVYAGATLRGDVRIHGVRPHPSYGAIRIEKNAIAPGDSATTCL